MDYKQYNLEKLQDMFDKEQNPEELNKIMSVITDKQGISSDDYEETNNTQLEEEIYQQMNLIKLEDLNVLPLEEIRKKLEKKFEKQPLEEEENNEVGEEIDINLVKNVVVPKPDEWGESSRGNTRSLRPRYVSAGKTTNFSFGFIPRKMTSYEEIDLTPISQTGYILNIDGARNREEIFEHWKRGMNSVLNLNTTWTAANFLNYIEYSFSGTVADWYDTLNEEGKNKLRIMESPEAMFRKLCKEIEIEFIGSKLDSEKKTRE